MSQLEVVSLTLTQKVKRSGFFKIQNDEILVEVLSNLLSKSKRRTSLTTSHMNILLDLAKGNVYVQQVFIKLVTHTALIGQKDNNYNATIHCLNKSV